MIIRTPEGRTRTVRTPAERRAALLRRLGALPPDERRLFEALLYEEQAGRPEIANECYAKRYRVAPVDMATFIDDPYYLGESCQTLYPVLRRKLIEIFEPGAHYREVILGGSTGWGKTTALSIAMCRLLYELSCLVNPQASYGMSPGSEMSIVLVSRNLVLARQVLKSAIDNKLAISPYFQEHFKPDVHTEATYFPYNVQMIVASYLAERSMGTNAFAAALDETNFVRSTKQKIRTADGQQKSLAHYDHAEVTYRSLERRIKSRFVQASGDLPGMIVMVSSANTVGSFIDRRLAAAHHDPSIYAMEMATWEVKPPGSFSGRTFQVLCGGSSLRSRILPPGEEVNLATLPDEARVIAVPEEYRVDFESNLEDAIRDIAGVPTTAISVFIQRTEKIQEAVDPARRHPAHRQTWQYGEPLVIHWHQLAKSSVRRLPGGFEEEAWTPLRNPKAFRYVHIDTSLSGDCTGIAMGHIERWVEVVRRTPEGDHYTDLAPAFVLDLVLQVRPPPGEQIQLADIRAVVYDLQAHGFSLIGFSCDQYQSADTLQAMRRRGVASEILSVDVTMVPYEALRSAIYERRIELYDHAPLLGELRALEHDRMRGKIDHPMAGCFVGETRIPLMDGTRPTIAELCGREVWVYSARNDGTIVPGLARGRLTKTTSALLDVVLDSGAVVRCTPEHPWMLRDGSYKPASDLVPGVDRLMPISQVWPVNGGYERLTDAHGHRTLTHYLVAEHFQRPVCEDEIVHHRNGVKTDNRPDNIEIIRREDHSREHTIQRHLEDAVYEQHVRDGLQAFNLSARGRAIHAEAMSRMIASMTPEQRRARARKSGAFRSDVDLGVVLEAARNPSVDNANAASRAIGCGRNTVMRVLREHGFSSWSDLLARHGLNHKVRAVIPVQLADPVPVYDLEVDVWNNFALSAGVFVHNSKDCADAVAGVVAGLLKKVPRVPLGVLQPGEGRAEAEDFAWVTGQPGPEGEAEVPMLPFLMG